MWLWRVPHDPAESDPSRSSKLINALMSQIPVFHTRAMRRAFIERYSLVAGTSPSVLNDMYELLTGDASVPSNAVSKEVRHRLQTALEAQDQDMVFGLRHLNDGRLEKYTEFYSAARAFIEREALPAAHDRRHSEVCHIGMAISVRDFLEKVAGTLRPNTPVPSVETLCHQFAPRNLYALSSAQYTGQLQLRFMVQSRHFHHDHPDVHYVAAIFKYLHELAIQVRSFCTMAFMDDKHLIKVGEPGCPVAAVDRGKAVLVAKDTPLTVADHDFTKLKLTPSAVQLCGIPDTIDKSFYSGRIFVTLKDSVFEASSPLRHMMELSQVFKQAGINTILKPIVLLYTDGGPDHRSTYVSVQASLICFFLRHNLDLLVAARTAPMNSYRNPAERAMALLNLALYGVGTMCQVLPPDLEKIVTGLNSMKAI